MNRLALLGGVTALALLVGAALILLKPPTAMVGGPSPSPSLASPSRLSASPPPSAAVVGLGLLDASWVSHRHGYSIGYPGTWTATPASADWQKGKRTLWGDPALDTLAGTDARLVAASQPLAPGKSADDWYTDYCVINGGSSLDCGSATSRWQPIQIGGVTGYLDSDGEHSPPNGIAADGLVFDAVVVSGGRGYEFTLDGDVDRASFDRMMTTVRLSPTAAFNLTSRFTSQRYGYSIGVDPRWSATPAKRPWAGFASVGQDQDEIAIGASSITGSSQPLPSGQTLDEWLAGYPGGLAGCSSGPPSSWPTIPVGNAIGRLNAACTAAEAFAAVGGRVYWFTWAVGGYSDLDNMTVEGFRDILLTVTFDPAAVSPVSPGPSGAGV